MLSFLKGIIAGGSFFSGLTAKNPGPSWTSNPEGPRTSIVSPIGRFSKYWVNFPPSGNLG